MRLVLMVALLLVLGAGVGVSYLVYRQMDTRTVRLDAPPRLVQSENGDLCGQADFVLKPRTVGEWVLSLQKGQTVSGFVVVAGRDDADIGLRIYSPSNRLVFSDTKRSPRPAFEVPALIRGDYLFKFDNRHSVFTDKQVTVAICVS
jgi:hypothetical protein